MSSLKEKADGKLVNRNGSGGLLEPALRTKVMEIFTASEVPSVTVTPSVSRWL